MPKRYLEEEHCELSHKRYLNEKKFTNVLSSHEILTDITGKQWQLGRRIGTGGFGIIFLVSDILHKEVTNNVKYICKIEEHQNGPLFVERNCYLRIAQLEMIENWKRDHNMKSLGMPHYVASGSHTVKNKKFRFLIIPKYDCDLEQIFNLKGKIFNIKTVCLLSIHLLDVLQYIHDKGYIHADVKASNILLKKKDMFPKSSLQVKSSPYKSGIGIRYHGLAPIRMCRLRNLPMVKRNLRSNGHLKILESNNSPIRNNDINDKENDQVYLLDYGLATKYLNPDKSHKLYCRDERKVHAGTILFCSVDAHEGALSRRSDLESLGYNIIYWLTGTLPWEDNIEDPETVEKKKLKCLSNLKEFLVYTFKEYPKFVYDYFLHLQKLKYDQKPDYDYFKNLFKNAIIEHGYKNDDSFDFDSLEKCTKRMKKANIENKHKVNAIAFMFRSPLRANLRVNLRNNHCDKKISWSKILVDPEGLIKQCNKHREKKLLEINEMAVCSNINNLTINNLNPTPAMMHVYNRFKKKENNCTNPHGKGDNVIAHIDGYTQAMMDVQIAMEQRKEAEYEQMVMSNNNNNNKPKQRVKHKKKKSIQPIITRSITHHTTRSEMQRKIRESYVNIYRLKG